jgi:hypothetical protein
MDQIEEQESCGQNYEHRKSRQRKDDEKETIRDEQHELDRVIA